MPIKDIQKNREYQKEWARRRRLGLNTKIVYGEKIEPTLEEKDLKRIHRNKLDMKSYKKRYKEKKEKLDFLLGNKCIICESKSHLIAHEIHGKKHKGDGHNLFIDALKRPKDFVRVCYGCHKGIHWAMEWMGMSWEEIMEMVNKQKINKRLRHIEIHASIAQPGRASD